MQGNQYELRKKPHISIFEQYERDEEDLEDDKEEDYRYSKSRPRRKCKSRKDKMQEDYEVDISDDNLSDSDIFDPNLVVDRLPSSPHELMQLQNKVNSRIEFYK